MRREDDVSLDHVVDFAIMAVLGKNAAWDGSIWGKHVHKMDDIYHNIIYKSISSQVAFIVINRRLF